MRKKKKNGFWTFCFSFVPGAVEMYMGFMKMGLSLMSVFFGTCFIAAVLNIGPLLVVPVIAWFYGFFHARNMAGMNQQEIDNMEDTYVLEFGPFVSNNMKNVMANQKVIAIVLLVIGIYLVWDSLFSAIRWFLPYPAYEYVNAIDNVLVRIIMGAGIIFAGYRLIKGKKMQLFGVADDIPEKVEKLGDRAEEEKGGDERSNQCGNQSTSENNTEA